MRKFIPLKVAVSGSIFLLSALILFHLAILLNLLPGKIVWGGRMKSEQQLYLMEPVSLFINIMMLLLVIRYANEKGRRFKGISILFMLMFIFFVINSIGNLFSLSFLEAIIFTPVSVLLALFSLRIFIETRS